MFTSKEGSFDTKKFVLAAVLTGALSGTAFAQTASAGTAPPTISVRTSDSGATGDINVSGCPATVACVPQLTGSVSIPFNVAGPVTAYTDRGSVLLVTVLGVQYFVQPAFVNITLNGVKQTVASHQSLLGANCTII